MTSNFFPRPWRQVVVASPQPSIANRPLWRRMPSCVPGQEFVCRVRDFGFCVIACLFGVNFVVAPLGTCWPTTNLKHRSCNELYVSICWNVIGALQIATMIPSWACILCACNHLGNENARLYHSRALFSSFNGRPQRILLRITCPPLSLNISKDWGVASHPLAARVQALAPKSSGEEVWGAHQGSDAICDDQWWF